jgi:hypothetical protein
VNAPSVPGPGRRGSLTAPAGTAAAAGPTAPDDAQAAIAAPGISLIEAVLAVNWTLPADRKIRVLAGEPPFDWSTVTSASQIPWTPSGSSGRPPTRCPRPGRPAKERMTHERDYRD